MGLIQNLLSADFSVESDFKQRLVHLQQHSLTMTYVVNDDDNQNHDKKMQQLQQQQQLQQMFGLLFVV